ncbi:MAG: hypothetical protein LCH26_07355 [Proteobacteria bacterium]|nr:hypothetical protein [Pseudomonadota bacterium]
MKKVLLTAMYLTLSADTVLFASAQPETIFEDAQETPAPTRLFQGERDTLQAAKEAFIAKPSPDTFTLCDGAARALLSAMGARNARDEGLCDATSLLRMDISAGVRHRTHSLVPTQTIKNEAYNYYLPRMGQSVDAVFKLRAETLQVYLSWMRADREQPEGPDNLPIPELFAGHGITQQRYVSDVTFLRRKIEAGNAAEAWETLKTRSASDAFNQSFVTLFWKLQKPLQDLLIVTGGDKTNRAWLPRVLHAGPEAQESEEWGEICAMQLDMLKKSVAPLVDAHKEITAEIEGRDAVQKSLQALNAYDDFNTSFNALYLLFWSVEKALIDLILLDQKAGANEDNSLFNPLLSAWVSTTEAAQYSLRDTLMRSLLEATKKRYGLTYFFCNEMIPDKA